MLLALQPAPFLYASSGTEGAAFLDIPVGAGPAALGSAYSAAAKDAYAPIYNPAGLGFVTPPEIAGQHLDYLDSISYEFGSVVIPPRQEGNELPGSFDAVPRFGRYRRHRNLRRGHRQLLGSLRCLLARLRSESDRELAVGRTGKLIDAKIADASAKAYAGDAGAMYQASEKVTFSATANNLGSKLTFTSQGDSLPTAYHLGAAFHLQNNLKSTVEGVYSKTGLLCHKR